LRQLENAPSGKDAEMFHLTYEEACHIEKEMKQLPLKEGEAYFL
jgi:hypothetical protein